MFQFERFVFWVLKRTVSMSWVGRDQNFHTFFGFFKTQKTHEKTQFGLSTGSRSSVSAKVCFLRFWRNKLTADALTVCLCIYRDAHKNSSENETLVFMCQDRLPLDGNASINIYSCGK